MSNSPYKMDVEFANKIREAINLGLECSFSYGEEDKDKAKKPVVRRSVVPATWNSPNIVPSSETKIEQRSGFRDDAKEHQGYLRMIRSSNKGCDYGCGCVVLCMVAGLIGVGVTVSHLTPRAEKIPTQPAIKQQTEQNKASQSPVKQRVDNQKMPRIDTVLKQTSREHE